MTALIPSPHHVRDLIDGPGYVLIPEAITPEEARRARTLLVAQADAERAAGTLEPRAGKERLYGLIYRDEVFARMAAHPQVVAIAEVILGEMLALGGFSAHILHPGAPSMGAHVDYPYWSMAGLLPATPALEVQAIWFCEDFTEVNGAPRFVPETQKLAQPPDRERFEREAIAMTGPAGSVALSHGLCWHDTGANKASEPRVSVLGNYAPRYIRPLEDMRYGATPKAEAWLGPKLRHLLRFERKPDSEPLYRLWE